MTALEMATQLVDSWASECTLLVSPDKRETLLIQMIAHVLNWVENEAYERGWRDGEAAS